MVQFFRRLTFMASQKGNRPNALNARNVWILLVAHESKSHFFLDGVEELAILIHAQQGVSKHAGR